MALSKVFKTPKTIRNIVYYYIVLFTGGGELSPQLPWGTYIEPEEDFVLNTTNHTIAKQIHS